MRRLSLVVSLAALALTAAGPAPAWRAVNPEDVLVVETNRGRIVIEMAPLLAPKAVERIRLLARERVYDGLLVHRVVDGFVNQTGNPNNRDGGTSRHPDLPPEFQFRVAPEAFAPVVTRSDAREGFVGSVPVVTASPAEQARSTDKRLRGWGAYCTGVVGMGRQADPGSANSEIFFMRAPARRLDHEYTVWGRVVEGMDVVLAAPVGEPPAQPDVMRRVRVSADLPPAERPRVEIADPRGAAFQAKLTALLRARGPAFSICDVDYPTNVR